MGVPPALDLLCCTLPLTHARFARPPFNYSDSTVKKNYKRKLAPGGVLGYSPPDYTPPPGDSPPHYTPPPIPLSPAELAEAWPDDSELSLILRGSTPRGEEREEGGKGREGRWDWGTDEER